MKEISYTNLMRLDPIPLYEYTNQMGQDIVLCVHPVYGETMPVIVLFPSLGKAVYLNRLYSDELGPLSPFNPIYIEELDIFQLFCKIDKELRRKLLWKTPLETAPLMS